MRKLIVSLKLFLLKVKFYLLPKRKIPKVYLVSTETVVGLTTEVSKLGKQYLCLIKKRDPKKKFAIAVTDINQARKNYSWDPSCEAILLKEGAPITIICNQTGFRFIDPSCKSLQEFYRENPNFFLTSANLSGDKPLSLEEAGRIFGDRIFRVLPLCKTSNLVTKVIDAKTGKIIRGKGG